MSNKTYDILKTIALVATPFIAFIGSVCVIWGVPHAEQITATLTAVDTLIGALLLVDSKRYNTEMMMDNEVESMGMGDEDE